jgi:uncharacterized protein (DUF1501 family)
MRRRDALRLLVGAGSALSITGRLFAAPPGSPRFLLIFLRGGYDCANVLVPYSSDDYYETRPTIAIAKPGSDPTVGAVALDANWALAPALRESVAQMYARREAVFIPFAGTDDLSRSHFETQDSIELGAALPDVREQRSGFLARLAELVNAARPIAFTDSLPVCFRGGAEIPNVSLKAIGKPVFDARQAQILAAMYAGNSLQAAVAEGLELRQQVSAAMAQEMQDANRGAIAPKGFELEARRIGRLMRDEYRIGFVDIGGWDTHVNEGGAQGALAANLESLGRGVQALAQELGPEWRNTVVAVISEFGRTFRENGNRGTDHGHGSVYWLLGGSIAGGRVAGEQVRVARAMLFQDRDYPVLNDYRAMLGGVFRSLWALTPDQVQRVFPSSAPVDLQIL